MTSKELREKWLNFYTERGHKDIGGVSLIGDGSTGVMFNVAGMQPLMPYLLGKKHPMGTRLCNVQGCVRTNDIDNIGDETHFTFFEMMGNWSLGDYFKKEKTQWSYDILTKVFGFDGNKICATVFEGDENCPRDTETAELLEKVGVKKENIFYLPKSDNWWDLPGTIGTPCGPDNEWFYPRNDKPCSKHCGPACGCGRYVEVGNDVYMQFEQLGNGKYKELKNKNVDTGFGFERNLAFLNGITDCYKLDLFENVIKYIEKVSGKIYGSDAVSTRAMRVIADHTRTSVMLIGDINGIVPSNIGAGYILRRLMRRAIRYANTLGMATGSIAEIAKIYIEEVYNDSYPLLCEKEKYIIDEINKEEEKFLKTLEQGTKEFNKLVSSLLKFAPDNKKISGDKAFRLFDTYGFPLELTIEMAKEVGFEVDADGFEKAFEKHQEISKSVEKGVNKGGLVDDSIQTTRLHTAVHLLQAGLRKYLGDSVFQRGSNITSERARFDFSYDKPMTDEEIQKVEDFVNNAIKSAIPVEYNEMTLDEARKSGALGIFDSKYGDVVKTYKIGNISHEICGGPHAKNTAELGKFKIIKEQSSSSGVRRIRAEIFNN
ncbi:MAG: alanine--tRNA ligase [Clostridia bacterium]